MEMGEQKKMNYIGIMRYHINTCQEVSCLCKKKTVFDTIKNRMSEINDE